MHTDISRDDTTLTVRTVFEETAVRYDACGRPERVQDAAGDASLITYDPCGRPVELLDADGGLTRVERDLDPEPSEEASRRGWPGRKTSYA